MISVEDCVEMEIVSLKEYVEASNERLLNAVEQEKIMRGARTKKRDYGSKKEELHGKAITFTVYEKYRGSKRPGNLEVVKEGNTEKGNRRNANGSPRSGFKDK